MTSLVVFKNEHNRWWRKLNYTRVSNDKQKIIVITATPYGENDKVSKNLKPKTAHVKVSVDSRIIIHQSLYGLVFLCVCVCGCFFVFQRFLTNSNFYLLNFLALFWLIILMFLNILKNVFKVNFLHGCYFVCFEQ